jgi:hypothetical protein
MPAQLSLAALNNRPLNREATAWINQAQVEPDPSYQAMYQLLLWGLGPGGLKWTLAGGDLEPFRNYLEDVATQKNQAEAYRYLVEDPRLGPEEPRLAPGDLAAQKDPRGAAYKLLECWVEALTADQSLVPSYPPTSQPA